MFKNENGFSLVELAIAAGLAVALAATAVTILSGTTASLSSKANGAAGTSTTYNSDVLANASGAVSGNTGGNAGGNTGGVTLVVGTDIGSNSWISSTGLSWVAPEGGASYSNSRISIDSWGKTQMDSTILGKTLTITTVNGHVVHTAAVKMGTDIMGQPAYVFEASISELFPAFPESTVLIQSVTIN